MECPNCGDEVPGIVYHCCDARDGSVDYSVGTPHCGCYHHGDPGKVKYHWENDCLCADGGKRKP